MGLVEASSARDDSIFLLDVDVLEEPHHEKPSLRVSPRPHITALYTPIAKNPPAKAAMTYLCAGGRGAPDHSSYAIAPLDPARGRDGGWAMSRTRGKRAGVGETGTSAGSRPGVG